MTYPGGKNGSGVFQQIINQIPPHEIYIVPFLGRDAVLLHKKPAAASIGIDIDEDVIQWWRDHIAAGGDGTITLIHGNAISYLRKLRCRRSTFVYCDPPFLFDVRSSKRKIYTHEFGDRGQHEKLLKVLQSLNCMVAISGYWSSLYESSLQGWRHISYNAVKRSGEVVREFLWMNYPEPVELHDYRFLGQNFREREKIARQKKRWRRRLLKMSRLQRCALLSSLADLGDASGSL